MIYDYRQPDDRTGGGSVFFISDEVYSADDSMSDSLEHHGVAGQKWGVKHGPPYPLVEGAKKVTYNVGKMTEKTKAAVRKKVSSIRVSRAAKKASKAEAKQAKKTNIADAGPKKFTKSKQRISDMSSEELQARINRLKLEQEYKKYLNGDPAVQNKVGNGKSGLDTVLNAVGNSTLKKVGDEIFIGLAKVAVNYASTAAKNAADRNHDRIKKNREMLHEERKRQYADANYAKDSARKNRETFNETFFKEMAKEMAKDEAERRRKNDSSRSPIGFI